MEVKQHFLVSTWMGDRLQTSEPAYYHELLFLKHGKKRSSGGSTVSSAGDSRWMSTGICRSNGRYLIQALSKVEQ
jgi:hypothetical protein